MSMDNIMKKNLNTNSAVDRIRKRKINFISKGYQNKIELALEKIDMEGKVPLNKKNYGDPDIIAHKLLNTSREDKKKSIRNDNAQVVLK